MLSTIYIEGWRLDQYKDENVNVVSQILDIKDIEKNATDYALSFTVPPSSRNNILFKHWYDFNIDNGYDARAKKAGEIYLDGILFKEGFFRLEKGVVKKGRIAEYVLSFTGSLPSIKDKAKALELKDLFLEDNVGYTYDQYDHDYDSATVKTGLTSSLLGGDVIYSLFSNKQYYFKANGVDDVQTETLANIAWDAGDNTGVVWNDLKPSLKVLAIIEAIEAKLGISFSRDFFGTSEFSELFMWLNPDKKKEINGNFLRVDFDSGDDFYMDLTTDEGTYPTSLNASFVRKFKLFLEITPEPGYENVDYQVKYYKNGEVAGDWQVGGTNPITTFNTNEIILQNNDEDETFQVYFEVISQQELSYTAFLFQKAYIGGGTNDLYTYASADTISSRFIVSENIPKMKIIDFLKGIFKMYKLVIYPTDEDVYYVNTVEGYYAEGISYDLTKYIDWESYDVNRGEILNEINFKFQDPKTLLNIQYKSNNGVGYGDEDARIYTDSTEAELLDGGSLVIELPFEQILYERLYDLETELITNVQYAAVIDESLDTVNPKAHLHYNSLVNIAGSKLGFITDTGGKILLDTTLNTPSHGDNLISPQYSTTFAKNFSTWSNLEFDKNLYTNHYKQYVEDIFNIKKRTTKIKANLPIHIITKLKLNDIIYIKGNYYRIDKYSYNLLDGKADFDLVNSFDNTISPLKASTSSIYVTSAAVTKYVQLFNAAEALPTKSDVGDGVTWVTLNLSSTIPNLLEVSFDENTTEDEREMYLELANGGVIYLFQSEKYYIPTLDFSDYRNSQYLNLII